MSASTGIQEQAAIMTDYVADWKDNGGKVLAYSCVATPVEILEAAGILPYRLKALGNPDTYLADGELSPLNCSFCRSCLQLGMDGTYDFLDGLIETKVRDVRARAERIENQHVESCEKRPACCGNFVHVGAVGDVADTKAEHIPAAVFERDRNDLRPQCMKRIGVDAA